MKKRIISLLMVVCLIAALLPTSVLAAPTQGTIDNPWMTGSVKAYVDGSTLYLYGTGSSADYTVSDRTQPWQSLKGSITSVVVADSVQYLGNYIFNGCVNLTRITLKRDLANKNPIALGTKALPSGIEIVLDIYGSGEMDNNNAAQIWANLKTNVTEVIIHEGVQSIGDQAFLNCFALQSVQIPSTVYYIGSQAFYNCTSLKNVMLYHGFANGMPFTIADDAFPTANEGFKINLEVTDGRIPASPSDGSGQPWAAVRQYIRSLVIGSGVTEIGEYAFSDCTGITGVNIYFTESALSAQKTFGKDWLRWPTGSAPAINVEALLGENTNANTTAFKGWEIAPTAVPHSGESIMANPKAASTVMTYDKFGGIVTARWETKASTLVFVDEEGKYEGYEEFNFGEMDVSYSEPVYHTFTLKNIGNKETDALLVELSGGSNSSFLTDVTTLDSIAQNGTGKIIVTPVVGLSASETPYTTRLAISNHNGDELDSIKIVFTVSTAQMRANRYVKSLYINILGRTEAGITDKEIKYWADQLLNNQVTAAGLAAEFFACDEFRNQNVTDTEFIQRLYLAVLGRTADTDGLNRYLAYLTAGKSRSWVFKAIVDSQEFANHCIALTLNKGTIEENAYNMSNKIKTTSGTKEEKIREFVAHLYSAALGRSGDYLSVENYVDMLLNKNQAAAIVAAQFFISDEYRSKNTSNDQFLEDVYQTLLGRGADATGKKNFANALASGKTRAWVFSQIAASAEFNRICDAYQVKNGTIDSAGYNMEPVVPVSKINAENYVAHLYNAILGRSGSASEIAVHVDAMQNKRESAASVAAGMFASNEYRSKNTSDEQFLENLYQALLNRSVDESGKASFKKSLAGGKTRAWVFEQVCKAGEYAEACTKYDLKVSSINAANYNMQPKIPANKAQIEAFVENAYNGILGRASDASGKQLYVDKMLSGEYSACDVIANLFAGSEFAGKALSDEQFVEAMYKGALKRGSDPDGKDAYMTALASGKSRSYVLGQLLNSAEFAEHCAAISVNPGSYSAAKWVIK